MNWFSRNLMKVAHIINTVAKKMDKTEISPFKQEVNRWFKDMGDKTLRLNYNMNENSVVFDLGGYEGQWSSDIYAKYNCKIFVFEPYIPFAQNIEQRFNKNSNIRVFPFGLGPNSEIVEFSESKDGSSIFKKSENTCTIEIVSVIDFLKNNNIDSIDLLKINIEGAEYDLLDTIIESDYINRIRNIQVQFHQFIDNSEKRREKIQNNLLKTHELTYNYEFVWENWQLKQ